ncbi:hypothetical protein [Methylocystis sp. Sn-Cys]|uniref:hypothetical protein n=1 Tax=Methylocystis sp. Sn-Cys TaxID=1701263 RepID=UPI00192214A6|nr:hypothetical protein [Methylocystis sp. Sn-Cys]MBL1258331.1 hypothetical protein [Methylocystis sp. Sn-Cys]
MIFLLKCLACIAIVIFAVQWREPEAPTRESHAHAAAPKPPRRPSIEDSAREWAQAGADALVSAAREKCLAAPRDCAATLQRLQGGGHER